MSTFDIKHYARLLRVAAGTDYFNSILDTDVEISDLLSDIDNPKALDEYTIYDILHINESIAYGDNTQMLPPEVAKLVEYGYQLAVEIKEATYINDYGVLFYTGRIGYQDFKKAAHYYQMASDLGCVLSTENLGYIYYYGRAGEVDYKRAFEAFSIASEKEGRACATYKLGDMYKSGYYVEKDKNKAYELYKKAESLLDNGKWYNDNDNVGGDVYFRMGSPKSWLSRLVG